MNRRQKIIVSVTGIFLVLLLLVGLTYAYFLTRITGNTNDKSISVSTANLAIVYGNDDGSVIGEGEKITPGTTFEPKTFTVTNNGNANTDYVVVIEDASVTYAETIEVDGETQTAGTETTFESNDFTYTLTCESYFIEEGEEFYYGDCNRIQDPVTVPIDGGILVGNRLEVGEIQKYSFTLTYNETGENQSNDMNKKLEAKINIKDITTINPYSDKPNTLAYTIINNAVALTNEEKSLGYAELVGTPYTNVLTETSKINTFPGYEVVEDIAMKVTTTYQQRYITYATSYSIDPETGLFSLVNPQTCKYNEANCVRDLLLDGEDIYLTRENARFIFSTDDTLKESENLTLVYKLVNAPEVSDTDITLTIRRITNAAESVISTTQDDYGTSYYYRGAVKNNYLEFNDMCWRIVRIEGDGAVKVTLAAQKKCNEITDEDINSAIIGKGSYYYRGTAINQEYTYDYLPPTQDANGKGAYDPTVHGQYTSHLKYVYNMFLNGGRIEYTDDGSYKGDGTDNIIIQEYKGFSEEKLDFIKNEKICLGDKSKTYFSMFVTHAYYPHKRLYDDFYTTLLCNGGDYTNLSKVFPLTIDEIIFAGMAITIPANNYNYYLRENAVSNYWLSTYKANSVGDLSLINTNYFYTHDTNIAYETDSKTFIGIRPAISLIPNIELTSGDGTINNPYIVG